VQDALVAGFVPVHWLSATAVPSERMQVAVRACVPLPASALQLALRVCVMTPQPDVGDHAE